MNRGNLDFAFILILVFGGIVTLTPGKARPVNTVPPSAADQATGTPSAESQPQLAQGYQPAIDLISRFLRGVGVENTKPLGSNDPRSGIEVEWLIATVPDPTEPRLGDMFDTMLESLQRVVGSANFVLDRVWLPWLKQRSAEGSSTRAAPPSDRFEKEQPGVMLFRRQKRLMVVFLIELPQKKRRSTGRQSSNRAGSTQ